MGDATQYWMEDLETASRSDLSKIQLEKLRSILSYSETNSKFYQKKFKTAGLSVSNIKSLDDIQEIPLTGRDEIVQDQEEQGQMGTLMCTRFEDAGQAIGRTGVRLSATGKPIRVIISAEDAASQGRLAARGLTSVGIGPSDYLYIMDYPQFNLLYMHVGLGSINLGSKSLLAGMERAERNTSIYTQFFPPTAFYISPSYTKLVTRFLEKTGRTYPIQKVLGWSEPGYSLPSWKARFQEMWRKVSDQAEVNICDVYGMVELGLMGFECTSQSGLHGFEDAYIYEIIDSDTGVPLPPGEQGELVVTHLEREGMPLIRYRTGDVTSVQLDPCACGRTHLRLMGIKGRLEQALIVTGKRIFQSQIEEALGAYQAYSGEYNIFINGSKEAERLDINILKEGMTEEKKKALEATCEQKLGVPVRAHLMNRDELTVFVHRSQKIFTKQSRERFMKEAAEQLKYET